MNVNKISGFLRDFRDFAVKGNVVDMAVGIIIGAAFTSIVNSLVKDVFTPLLGLMTGGIDFTNLFITLRDGAPEGPYTTLASAEAAGAVTINYGIFLNATISFIIVAFVCYLMIRNIAKLKRMQEAEHAQAAVTQKTCPFCKTLVDVQATRCPACTSELAV